MPITVKNSAGGGVTLDSSTSSNETINLNNPVFTGSVGIGTASPDERLHVMESSAGSVTAHTESVIVAERNGNCYFSAIGTTGAGLLMANTAGNEIGRINYAFSNNNMQFYTNNGNRMTILGGGNVLFGTANASPAEGSSSGTRIGSNGGSQFSAGSTAVFGVNRFGSDGSLQEFRKAGTLVGSIGVNGSSTSFNTSSDYRLKENVTPMSGATAQTKLLKPCNFDWIAGGNVNGFIAHELAEVVPEAVHGTKDAMRDEEYEVTPATDTEVAVMGTRSVPDLQGIDQSKLVPLLTATIQDLITRIEALESK